MHTNAFNGGCWTITNTCSPGMIKPRLVRASKEFCESLHPSATVIGQGSIVNSVRVQVPGIDTFSGVSVDYINFCAKELGLRVCSSFSHDPSTSLLYFQVCELPSERKLSWFNGWTLWAMLILGLAIASATSMGPQTGMILTRSVLSTAWEYGKSVAMAAVALIR